MALPRNVVELVLRLRDELSPQLSKVGGSVRSFGLTAATIGATALAGLVGGAIAAANRFSKLAVELDAAGKKAGITGAEFNKLAVAGTAVGVSSQSISAGISTLQKNIGNAAAGNKEARKTFEQLGLSISELGGLNAREQLDKLAGALVKINDQSTKTALGTKALGGAYDDLIPLLGSGAGAISKLVGEQEKLGRLLNQTQIDNLKEYKKQVDALGTQWEQFAASLTGKVVPALTAVLKKLNELSAPLQGDQLKNNLKRQIAAIEESIARSGQPASERALRELAILQRQLERVDAPVYGEPTRGRIQFKAVEKDAKDPAVVLQDTAVEFTNNIQSLYDEMNTNTRTALEREYDQVKAFKEELDALFLTGQLSAEAYNRRLEEGGQLTPIEVRAKKLREVTQEATEYQKQFARNMQDAFATAFNSIDKGIKGMLAAFLLAFKQILVQAAALKFAELLGLPGTKKGGSSGSGTVGAIISGIGKLFGFAGGGALMAGRAAIVGEEGPELFVPYNSGRIFNQNQLSFAGSAAGGGSVVVNQSNNFNISANADDSQRQKMLALMQLNNRRLRESIARDMREGNLRASR